MALSLSGNYVLWCRYTGDAISLSYRDSGGETTITPGAPGAIKYFHEALV